MLIKMINKYITALNSISFSCKWKINIYTEKTWWVT